MKTTALLIFLLGLYAIATDDLPQPMEKLQSVECKGQVYEYYASDPVDSICNYYSKVNEAYSYGN